MKNALALGIVVAVALIIWAIETATRRWLAVIVVCLAVLVLIFAFRIASARDLGQWDTPDPSLKQWYQALMQPDNPQTSCCGEADAYFCDDYFARDGKAFCRITDDRDDAPRGRPHVEVGTEIEIPPNKLKWDRSNPTGHGVVFLSRSGYVFCYVQGAGI